LGRGAGDGILMKPEVQTARRIIGFSYIYCWPVPIMKAKRKKTENKKLNKNHISREEHFW
jgi:hypothetical protein